MNYRSVADLNDDVRRLATDLSDDIDLIVGIPRSGLLVANLFCLHRDIPMTDVDGLCDGRLLETGRRYGGDVRSISDVDRVLVVDDSVNSGQEMRETKERIEAEGFPFDIEYGAVYISPGGYQHVDHWVNVVTQPRLFEWNVMHHARMENWCVDIDGVLCRDPTGEENDDGENYREFITGVDSRIVPSHPVGWLVTCRLERYRDQTETWLARHGIEYNELVMMDLPSKEARQARGNHAQYKAAVYDATGAELFVESSEHQAEEIADRSGKPVYCFESNRLISPGSLRRTREKGSSYLTHFVRSPLSFSRAAGEFLLRRGWHTMNRQSDRILGE